MTPEQAQRCFRSLEDVFTPEGDAVTVAALFSEGDEPASLALVMPHELWLPLAKLTAREDVS